jgi:hypothetical protein
MVELEPEVRIDLLAEQGPLLSEPYTRQLDGKLRELRFRLGGQAVREVDRARRALGRCIADEHTADDDGEE